MGVETTIEVASLAHADELAPVLRPEDMLEARASGAADMTGYLRFCVLGSDFAWTLRFNGEIAALFGVRFVGDSLLGRSGVGICWALTGEACSRWPLSFMRASRRVVAAMREVSPALFNWVDCRYVSALRWLEALGFEAGPIQAAEASGLPFQRMAIGGA